MRWAVINGNAPSGARVVVDAAGHAQSREAKTTTFAAERKQVLDLVAARFDENLDAKQGGAPATGLTVTSAWRGSFTRPAANEALYQVASSAIVPGCVFRST